MSERSNELPIPESVLDADEAMEIVRIWIVDGRQLVALSPRQWKDPAAWGLMLCDLARHVARQYEKEGHSATDVLTRIHEAFEVEWDNPTD